jgi:hypothetical protein
MNTRVVALVVGAIALGGCPKTPVEDTTGGGTSDVDRGSADDDAVSLGGKDVSAALADEQAALAELEVQITKAEDALENSKDPALAEAMLALHHDRTARQSFIAQLERCAKDATQCPPSLDEPSVPSNYDPAIGELTGAFSASVDEWPEAATAIAAAACGCRTYRCVEWVLADLARWESALTPHEEDAGDAAESVTLARECVWSRLGR